MPDELELFPAARTPAPAPRDARASSCSVEPGTVARVLVDVPLRRAFDYLVPGELRGRVARGSRVLVPFHGRKATGFVSALPETSDVAPARLKPLAALLEEQPVVTDEVLALAEWVSSYYACGPGEALA